MLSDRRFFLRASFTRWLVTLKEWTLKTHYEPPIDSQNSMTCDWGNACSSIHWIATAGC